MIAVIPSHPNYFVTPEGDVFSFACGALKKLRPGVSKGYRHVTLCRDGRTQIRKVHVLVAEAFLPRPEWASIVRHKDDDRSRNDVSNLVWGTSAENGQDKVRNGHSLKGSLNPKAKLTLKQVEEIRSSTENNASMARRFNVSETCIGYIRRGLRWVSP